MIYRRGSGPFSFKDMNRGAYLDPDYADTETGIFVGYIWLNNGFVCAWVPVSGIFPFDVIRNGQIVDKARP